MILKMWRQEFVIEGFKLNHHSPEDFSRCHWQKSERVKPLWVIYRGITAAYFFVSLLYTVLPIGREIPEENSVKYPIFLTHWTYVLETLVFLLGFIIACKAMASNKSGNPVPPEPMRTMPCLYKVYWVLFTIVLPSAVTVSVIFWVTIYDPVLFPADPSCLIEHAFNSIFIVIDFFLVAYPVKFLHFYWPSTYGLFYAAFSIIYQLSGGTGVKGIIPIYKILDWRTPGSAIFTCFLSLLFLLILHFLFCLLHLLKVYIKKKKSSDENA